LPGAKLILPKRASTLFIPERALHRSSQLTHVSALSQTSAEAEQGTRRMSTSWSLKLVNALLYMMKEKIFLYYW
jgi:hypothetical protein